MALQYDPTSSSTIGAQVKTQYLLRKALVDNYHEARFTPLSHRENMPLHYGKELKAYHYVPLLDDRNVNDQGIDANGATIVDGNLYGSQKDTGTIVSKLPVLGENGGRVNRVGYTRITREAKLKSLGFFHEYTRESIMFDSDEEIDMHLAQELTKGAIKLYEDALQADLLAGAGVHMYGGTATSRATVTGEGANPSVIDQRMFSRMDRLLTNNRSPMQTTIIAGSRNVDTRVIGSARAAFVGPQMLMHLREMQDAFGRPAFIDVQHYADAAGKNILNGEVGSIGNFRIVHVPDMQHWAGAGATATAANPGYSTTGTKYDVFPVLFVGDESFATIGFHMDGKTGGGKFNVTSKSPGREVADSSDPYGRKGFASVQWYYGTLIKRPERIALMYGVAPA